VLREHGFSETPYSGEAKVKLGYTEWHRRDELGNEHYVADYSNGRWQHTAATGEGSREPFDLASGQGAASLDQRLTQFRL
jgi:hypothetical protein